jgi:hypothetical protein
MLIDTQISSYLIPKPLWEQGYPGRADLPPLAIPTRDALDIERRAQKGVNLRNEANRYILCCERIQGIVRELAQESHLLRPPMVWPAHLGPNASVPSARVYLALIEALGPYQRRDPKFRFAAVFFAPEYADLHQKIFEAIRQGTGIDQLLERTAKSASLLGDSFVVSTEQCKAALEQRYELLKIAALEECGLVDVVELA